VNNNYRPSNLEGLILLTKSASAGFFIFLLQKWWILSEHFCTILTWHLYMYPNRKFLEPWNISQDGYIEYRISASECINCLCEGKEIYKKRKETILRLFVWLDSEGWRKISTSDPFFMLAWILYRRAGYAT